MPKIRFFNLQTNPSRTLGTREILMKLIAWFIKVVRVGLKDFSNMKNFIKDTENAIINIVNKKEMVAMNRQTNYTFFNHQVTEFLTRKNIEIVCIILILLAALSVFIGRIPTKETLTLDSGAITYNGYVLASKMTGKGKLTFENGDTYEGEFKNGIFHGKGTFTAAAGWTYVGEFNNGLAEGEGKLTTENKTIYEGKFKQGIYQHED